MSRCATRSRIAREAAQPFLQRLGDRDRPVPAAGAADADGQVGLPFGDVLRDQELQQVQRVLQEVGGRLRPVQEAAHFLIAAGVRPQRRHEMRVRQEPHVEQQVGVDRNAVLEPEAQDRDDQPRAGRAAARDAGEDVPQLVHRHRRRVDDVVGHPADRLHRLALLADALDRGPIGRERMRPARFAEAPHQRRLCRLEEDEHRVEVPHVLQPPVDARKLLEQPAFADVDDDRGARDLAAGAQRQLGEHRQQRDRQVVDAEVAEVLERANRLRLARTRQAGEHDEPRA